MKPTNLSHPRPAFRPRAAATGLMASVVLGAVLGTSAPAEMYHPPTNSAGGVQAQSAITSITVQGTNTTVCWYGMQGWYTVEMTTNLSAPTNWTAVGRTAASDSAWCLTVPNGGSASAQFRLNQLNAFAGSGACSGCHGDKFSEWKGTAHSSAYSTIANLPLPAVVKETCYPCHTVGKNQPTGFTSITNTPHLSDVGCENCHGPSAWHKYSDHDLIRPAVSIDPKICGGCHTDDHHPTFDEYEHTLHAEVNGDIKYGTATPGVYYANMLVIKGTNSSGSLNIVAPGTPGSTNCYGYYVTTNADLTLKTNYTTGILHSGNGPGSGNVPGFDPGWGRAVGCGICHSAATRMAQLKDYEARLEGRTNALVFAAANDAAAWSAACATCHDPHSGENPAQLRHPMWSTNYHTMPTTADQRTIRSTNFMGGVTTNIIYMSAAFANMYDPSVQVCGQCHNSRGARADGRSFGYYIPAMGNLSVTTNGPGIVWGVQTNVSFQRPPHHSPQYNILSGIVQPDYLNGTSNVFGAHSLNTNGCAACHMASVTVTTPTPESPNYTGHEFEPLLTGPNAYVGCAVAGCHGSISEASNSMFSVQSEVSSGIATLVSDLNNWAMWKGRALFGANFYNYLQNGWEYNIPGGKASITNAGPSTSEQLLIPQGIREARFNLYMVAYGNSASLGVHNPTYTRYLLADASNKVYAATYPLPTAPAANFSASTRVARGYPVIFSNKSQLGLTSWSWDFGDGNTSTLENPTNTYATVGTYTVTLIASGSGVPDNMKSNYNYITVYDPPTAAMAADVTAGLLPLTVWFTNLTTGGNNNSYLWNFGNSKTLTSTNTTVVTNTYAAAGTYTVTLRASSLGVTNTVTNVAYITVSGSPVAGFTAGPGTNGLVPLTVYFTNQSANATAYAWDFGDGNTSTSANPANTYTSAGNYTVTLKAINFGVTNTLTRTNYIGAVGLPVANFIGGPTAGIGMHPMTVTFTNLSVNATAYVWDFGDGNTSTSTSATVVNTYANVGTNTVTLQAINLGVTNTLVRTNYVFLTP